MARTTRENDEIRRLDNDRFLCAQFAPAGVRRGLYALLAFNLEVARIREAVSQPELGGIRLAWWSEAMDGVFRGAPPRHPVAEALAETVLRFKLSRPPFERLLEARALDMEDRAPADMGALVDYAEGTAATLTTLSLEVLGQADGAAAEAGRNIGIAWALTGLMRAVPFHARAGRVYLPETLCREAGLDMSDIRPGPPLAHVVVAVVAEARRHLDAARRHRRAVPGRALAALLPGVLADGYLKTLEKAGFDPFDERVHRAGPGRVAKLWVSALRGRY
jgi:NADH dehydrogenase [ubiquinone] 1 alpha subcomplex assembly factor 6